MKGRNRLISGFGRLVTARPRVFAGMRRDGISVHSEIDVRRNLYKPVRVKPEEAQTLQWLTPGNVLTYQIVTNLDWHIE